jgi:glucose/arabinose dehydrogenase
MKKLVLFTALLLLTTISIKLNAQAMPAGYVRDTVVRGLSYPVDFDWTPDGRYFVTQKGGNTAGSCANGKILVYSATGTLLSTFYDLTSVVDCDFERGVLGIAIDPDYATNSYVYVYYVHLATPTDHIRIMRFTDVGNVGTLPTVIMEIKLSDYPPFNVASNLPGNHFGGMMRFRPSDPNSLYFCIGDLAYNQGDSVLDVANKLNYPFGKILRIHKDGTIPTDNPYYDDGVPTTGHCDYIWSYGHRNDFGITFNPVTDSMYISENGWNSYDEFDIIHKGGNYGWAACEGNFIASTSGTATTIPCVNANYINPISVFATLPLGGVTGAMYYTGSVMPEFNNHVWVADNDYGRIYNLTMGNPPSYNTVTSNVLWADITSGGLTTLREGPDGFIYAMKGGYTTSGMIYRIHHTPTVGTTTTDSPENIIGQNYPNPTTGNTNIDFSIAQTSAVTIDLYDVTGRKVKTIYNASDVQSGKHTIELSDLSTFANGSYFYKMTVKQNNKLVYSETKRMIVSK